MVLPFLIISKIYSDTSSSRSTLFDFFCFHRNWVLPHVFFSHGSFLYHWTGSCRSITPCKKKQLHPQLPMSNGNFLTAEIYLSHTGGNGMQLCIALLAVRTGLLPTEGVSDMWINKDKLTQLLRRLCGGGGRPLSIWNIAEAATHCFIFKGIRPLQIKAFKILLDRNLNAEWY